MPKLKQPSLRQQRFVEEYAKSGNAADAARKAGYAPANANVAGYKLLNDKSLQRLIANSGIVGMGVLTDIALNGKVEIARVQASKELVERAYGKAKSGDEKQAPSIVINLNKITADGAISTQSITPVIEGETTSNHQS